MEMYEDFDLDVTVGTNFDDSTKAITFRTGCGTCNDCLNCTPSQGQFKGVIYHSMDLAKGSGTTGLFNG